MKKGGFILITSLLLLCAENVLCDEEGNTCGNSSDDFGIPLILTPYINNGSIEAARNLSKVIIQGWLGYSGFLTVDDECGANIFIWYIPAKNKSADCPLFVWLQGGPGASSMYGLFDEIGPFNHIESGFEPRNQSWNNNNHVIYIDQPIGTGFSFPKNSCLAENNDVITDHLYSTLVQFYKWFPELLPNKLYLTGESYAGHYIPALGVRIHEMNQNGSLETKINLVGTLIGNPLTRLACHNYSDILYQHGIVGVKLRDAINARQRQLELNVENGKYLEANADWYYILNDLIWQPTKMHNRENVGPEPEDKSDYIKWLNTSEARCLLHVGNVNFVDQNWDSYNKLLADIPKSYAPDVEYLLEKNYTMWFYSGNMDMICLTASTDCLLRGLNWWGADGFLASNRTPWWHDGSLAGYIEHYGPLNYVVFLNCGHSVPRYKPAACYDMINSVDFCTDQDKFCFFNTTEPE